MKTLKNLQSGDQTKTVIDIFIKLAILVLLLAWCFQIMAPFVSIIFWAMIITITLFPLYKTLTKKLKGNKKLSAGLITLLLLSIIFIPASIFTDSMIEGIQNYSKDFKLENFKVPPPDDKVSEWPLIGNFVYDTWALASENLEGAMKTYTPQIKKAGSWLIEALMGTGVGFIQFIISIIISGIFLATSEKSSKTIRKLYSRILGARGDEFSRITELTIRNVSKGVIGVAFIQSFLAGVVFVIAGVPYAGLWALFCLVLSIVQIGPTPVIIPIIIYLFTVSSTWVAVLWLVLLFLVMISDNILKPILMGKGAPVPTLVIFLGSIGGFIASGFVGLFLGAIVLSLGYTLFLAWIDDTDIQTT